MRRVRTIEKYKNENSLKEDFKYLKPILQMRTCPSFNTLQIDKNKLLLSVLTVLVGDFAIQALDFSDL